VAPAPPGFDSEDEFIAEIERLTASIASHELPGKQI
jgi:hypothetical protein